MLDISIMVDRPCAIHCSSEDQGRMIIEAVKDNYPEMAKLWNREDDTHWETYEGNTCYTLYDQGYESGLELDRLYFCNKEYYEDHGYEILEFEDLISDDIEMVESDISIEDFLGI